MKPYRWSRNKLALDLRLPVTRSADIFADGRRISPATALRLGRYCKTNPRGWLSPQRKCDWDIAEDE
jgi:antitoxin HigA-1